MLFYNLIFRPEYDKNHIIVSPNQVMIEKGFIC